MRLFEGFGLISLSMKPLYLFISITVFASFAFPEDWPGFGGINGDFKSLEKDINTNWDKKEPLQMWTAKVGLGFSSIIEAEGFAFTQGYSNGKNTLYCLQANDGKIIWKVDFPCPKSDNYFKGGSRTTPLFYNGNLYLCTHVGDLYCLSSESGDVKWSFNLEKDFKGKRPTWGYAASPVIFANKLFLVTGAENASLISLNPETGEVIWKKGNYEAAYASPVFNESAEEILVFHESGLSIHNIGDGEEKSFYQHKTRYGINAAQPLKLDKKILVSSAYGKGSAFIDFSGKTPSALWKTDKVASQMASAIYNEGFIYGIHGQAGTRSNFSTIFCLNADNGKIFWEHKGYGLSSIILVGKTLVVLSEKGELALIEANPNKFTELANFQVLSGKDNWIPPTYANGRLHCRSSDGDWVCLKLNKSL